MNNHHTRFFQAFDEEYTLDEESWSYKGRRILMLYENASVEIKRLIDDLFITLCGWSIKTLADKAGIALPERYYYDLWNISDGNYGYVETNLNPDLFDSLEDEFIQKFPKKEGEGDTEYLNRFFNWLRECHGVFIQVQHRPDLSVDLLHKCP